MSKNLPIVSHVARDILHSSEAIKTPEGAIWEYIANSLQYTQKGVAPNVRVEIRDIVTIVDNGRGMSFDDLATRFFAMHGVNQDRVCGNRGRGLYGVGKVAGLSIGKFIEVISIQGGFRNRLKLSRETLESSTGKASAKILERNIPTPEKNGTTIIISGLEQPVHPDRLRKHVESHLRIYPLSSIVTVNGVRCVYVEPPSVKTYTFRSEGIDKQIIGDVQLTIKVAKEKLPKNEAGIAVLSDTSWLETTLAGLEHRAHIYRLFGDIHVPKLESDASKPAAFDLTRSGKLNPRNQLVNGIYIFVSQKLEEVRKSLEELAKAVEPELNCAAINEAYKGIFREVGVIDCPTIKLVETEGSPLVATKKKTITINIAHPSLSSMRKTKDHAGLLPLLAMSCGNFVNEAMRDRIVERLSSVNL